MAKMQVSVISSSVVGTECVETATSISRLELLPWDLRLLPIVYLQRGLLFHKPKSHHFIHRLRTSLSRTLDFFPPLAGRLAADDNDGASFFVNCNNAGALFIHAVAASVSVSDLVESEYVPEFVPSLFPLNDLINSEGDRNPLLAVQVTELVDGIFIGCAANHAVVDGTSFWHFVNSWSEISRGSFTISKPPLFDRSFTTKFAVDSRLPPPPPPQMEQNQSRKTAPPPLLKRVFHFSKESMARLKSKANSEAWSNKISSFQALSALLWRTIALLQQPKHTHNPRNIAAAVNFALVVGARSRIGLPDSYFGNAIYTAATSATESELLHNGIGETALMINDLVTRQTREAAVEDFEDSENRNFIRKTPSFFIIGSPHHDVYGNDFGWGKPIASRNGKGRDFDGKLTISPAAEPGGVDLEVCLATEKMAAMENDPEFLENFL